MNYVYVRPLPSDPNCKQQLSIINDVPHDTLMLESHGSSKRRTVLDEVIKQLNKNDILIVCSLHILADSTKQLIDILNDIEKKGALLHILDIDVTTHSDKHYSFIEITRYLADFQSKITSEQIRKGLNKADAKGKQIGRPKKPDKNVRKAIRLYYSKKYTLAEIREKTGISKSTLYRYLEH